MTHDWEPARPTDLWNFLFMFRFNKKKISHVWLLYRAVEENALESYEKYLRSALEHSCRQTRRQGHNMALLFSQLSTQWPFPCPPRGKYQHSSLPSAPQPIFSPGTEVKKHMGTYPELLQLFLKWSPSQNAVCFAPYCAFQSSLVWYKSPECVCCWFCE